MRYLHGFLCQTEFLQCVDELMMGYPKHSFDLYGARNALARGPLYTQTLPHYGRLLGALLNRTHQETDAFYIATDAHLLATYLQAVVEQKKRALGWAQSEQDCPVVAVQAMNQYVGDPHRQGLEFIRVFMRSSLQMEARSAHRLFRDTKKPTNPFGDLMERTIDGLRWNGVQSNGDVHPALLWAIQQQWLDPADLLQCLNCDAASDVGPLDKALNDMLLIFRSILVQTPWRPTQQLHWSQLWLAHEDNNNQDLHAHMPWIADFVRIMVQDNAVGLHQALGYLAKKKDVPSSTMDAYFPLPLEHCDAIEVLRVLVLLTTAGEEGVLCAKSEAFNARLQHHHPQLHHLLMLHLALHPDKKIAVDSSIAMLDAFENIRRSVVPLSASHDIDASLFEEG